MNKLPPGLRIRGSSIMVDVTLNGVRKTGTIKGLDVTQALLLRESLKQELEKEVQGSPVEGAWSLKQAFEKTCELHWTPEETRSWKKLQANAFQALEFFGPATLVHTINSEKVDEWASHMKKNGSSGATINRKLSALSKMFTVAFRKEKLTRKPVIERRKETAGRIRFLSQKEEQLVLQTFETWGLHLAADVVRVLVDTGLRPSELWRLKRKDVDFQNKIIHIWQTKTDKPRSVPMTKRVSEILGKFQGAMDHVVLFGECDNYWFDRHWNKMKEHLGLGGDKEFIPYCLRHTCASRLIQKGVNLVVVQEWLGHKSILTTRRYSHLSPTNLLEAVKVLEK